MGSSRFYAVLSMLLFAAVCAYAGAAVFTALDPPPGESVPALAKSGGGDLRGIMLRYEEQAPESIDASAGERIPPGELNRQSALFFSECDGYEALSPDDAVGLDPDTLSKLMQFSPGQSSGAKLIYGFDCYYAAFYSGIEDIEPGPCRLRFEGESYSRRAEIISVSRSEGECAVLFRLMLAPELLSLRLCRAELIV